MVFHRTEQNQWVIPSSGYHMKISARERLRSFLDGGAFEAIENSKVAADRSSSATRSAMSTG